MKLIVGLGNPGAQYAKTRHNVGFMVVDALAEKLEAGKWKLEAKFEAEIAETNHNGDKLILAKPQTFMNDSGRAIQKLMQFYKIDLADVVIAYDEIDLIMGQIRVRTEGGSGGHRGVESTINNIGEGFTRVRIGIDPNDRTKEASEEYVLKPFSSSQRKLLPATINSAVSVILDLF
jgi:PTH1 family peptidyl-tRNA hydrolase